MGPEIAVVVGAYLVGTFPTGVLLARARGIDLRAVGSGNVGATNVSRALGKRMGVVALVGDLGKGLAATLAARALLDDPRFIGAAGFAAVAGHLFPIWLRFRGGKGVATGLGVMLGVAPWAGLAAALGYALVYAKTRLSSLGSLVGVTLAAGLTPFVTPQRWYWVLAGALWALIVARHTDNVRRLVRGEEKRV